MAVSIYSRYYNLPSLEAMDKVALQQRPLPRQQEFTDSIEHMIVGQETLDQLAKKYYGREDLWWRIADANPNVFPSEWKAGDKVIIPPIRVATRMPRR